MQHLSSSLTTKLTVNILFSSINCNSLFTSESFFVNLCEEKKYLAGEKVYFHSCGSQKLKEHYWNLNQMHLSKNYSCCWVMLLKFLLAWSECVRIQKAQMRHRKYNNLVKRVCRIWGTKRAAPLSAQSGWVLGVPLSLHSTVLRPNYSLGAPWGPSLQKWGPRQSYIQTTPKKKKKN